MRSTARITDAELQRWAEADPTGIAAKALTPMVVRRGSVASSGPAGRLSTAHTDKPATRKYQTPWPASVDPTMSAYTQVVQQTRWWKGTQTETQLVNTPGRGATGCRFGVLQQFVPWQRGTAQRHFERPREAAQLQGSVQTVSR